MSRSAHLARAASDALQMLTTRWSPGRRRGRYVMSTTWVGAAAPTALMVFAVPSGGLAKETKSARDTDSGSAPPVCAKSRQSLELVTPQTDEPGNRQLFTRGEVPVRGPTWYRTTTSLPTTVGSYRPYTPSTIAPHTNGTKKEDAAPRSRRKSENVRAHVLKRLQSYALYYTIHGGLETVWALARDIHVHYDGGKMT